MSRPSEPSDQAARWQQIERLVDQALDLEGAERASFVEELRDDRSEDVRAWLEAMQTSTRLDVPLDGRALDLVDRVLDDFSALLPGERVGSYRVVELLGEGGMGSVYRAQRIEGDFDHQVAIKILRKEMRGSSLAARFAREREILAGLDHPHIAKLFDGGSTEEDLPYFVLELVEDARPITEYCDQEQLDLRQRVAAFQRVCEAVQAAHRNLVIHRDIKPNNVLVDGEGVLKLVDFGIAKPVVAATAVEETQTQVAMLTPLSASPEQMSREPVATTSDVYQLGLLLYEILCGAHPHRVAGSENASLERVIAEIDPSAPSAVVRRLASGQERSEPAEVSNRAAASRARLARALSGDLDAIVLQTLRKEPERRYQTAADLAADLDRWLCGEPVSAQPDRLAYRLRKWAARNPALTVVSALAALSLAATVVVSLLFAVNSQRHAAQIERERDLAQEAQGLMTELFEAASPVQNAALAEAATAVEILDRGAERLRQRFRNSRPELLSEMLRTLASSNQELGRYEQAKALLEEALALDRQREGAALVVADDLLLLASVENTRLHYDQALLLSAEAIEVLEGLEGSPRDELARAQAYHAFASIMAADQPRREDLIALERAAEAAGVGRVNETKLAMAYRKLGELDRAIETYELLLERQQDEDPDSLEVASILNNLAYCRKLNGDVEGAFEPYRRALEILRGVLGEGHPRTLTTLNNLAQAFREAGQVQEELILRRQDVEILRREQPGGWRLGRGLESLAFALLENGEYPEAAVLSEEAYWTFVETLGANHDWLVLPCGWIGLAKLALGEEDDGQRWIERAWRGYESLGVEGVKTGSPGAGRLGLDYLVEIAAEIGRDDVAERFRIFQTATD